MLARACVRGELHKLPMQRLFQDPLQPTEPEPPMVGCPFTFQPYNPIAFRSAVSELLFISQGESKIIVWHLSAVNAGHAGSPLWLGLPVRAK
jgi:hypothetical protein